MSGEGDCSLAFTLDHSIRDFCAMILHDFPVGKSYRECFSSLTICFGDKSTAKSTVTKCYRELKFGRQRLEDTNRCGRPITAVTVEL